MFRCENRCSVDTEKKGGLVWAGCLPHDPVLSECDRHIYFNFNINFTFIPFHFKFNMF